MGVIWIDWMTECPWADACGGAFAVNENNCGFWWGEMK